MNTGRPGMRHASVLRTATLVIAASAALCSCAFNATLMARDSGKTYSGEMSGNGMGSGAMTVVINDTVFTGPVVRVGSNDSVGISNTFVTGRHGTFSAVGTSFSAGDKFAKALLSSPDGHGLRCDLRGRLSGGGGVCVDDNDRVYDVILTRK